MCTFLWHPWYWTCICTYKYIYTCIHACIYVYINTYPHARTETYTCARTPPARRCVSWWSGGSAFFEELCHIALQSECCKDQNTALDSWGQIVLLDLGSHANPIVRKKPMWPKLHLSLLLVSEELKSWVSWLHCLTLSFPCCTHTTGTRMLPGGSETRECMESSQHSVQQWFDRCQLLLYYSETRQNQMRGDHEQHF